MIPYTLIKRYTSQTLLSTTASKDNTATKEGVSNPAIYDNLMIYRDGFGTNHTRKRENLKFCHIDKNYEPIHTPIDFICCDIDYKISTLSDARFFTFQNKPYLMSIFVTLIPGFGLDTKIATIDMTTLELVVFNQKGLNKIEKNWMFFEYANELYCTYSLWHQKHVVYKVSLSDGRVSHAYTTTHKSCFDMLKPTSNLCYHDGLLWGVGHTQVTSRLYHMTFYAMQPNPPFKIVQIQQTPICAKEYAKQKQTYYILFPTYLNHTDEEWIVGMGTHDAQQMDIISINKQHINQQMKCV